jgi:ring-1,2-phenylacetyl-CoA epoxidase subunit PaaE
MASVSVDPARIRTIPDPGEPVPRLNWPTILLLAGGITVFIASTALALTDTWPWWPSVIVNAIAAFVLFTVSHEASHHSASSDGTINTWLGRLATPFFAPHAGFRMWRFIHMQHHRFTNHADGSDPDHYTHRGARWTQPLRWLTIDLWYVVFYVPKMLTRPRGEIVEALVTWAILLSIAAVAIVNGLFVELLVLYFLPIRIAVFVLGWAFDYLPHNELTATPEEDRFRATRNRIGLERLLSPLLLYQNYHLVHHLHPVVPFYRYIAVWRRAEDEYLAQNPALSDVRGRPLTVDEYRRLRELQEHHH